MEPKKIYRCTINGANATGHQEEKNFTVHKGSCFGEIQKDRDNLCVKYRHKWLSDYEAIDKDTNTLKKDWPFLFADEAAVVVTGTKCDESAWVAEDGTHPTLVSPRWMQLWRELANLDEAEQSS